MCGICGVIDDKNNDSLGQKIITRMCDSMAHRGPNDSGIYSVGNCSLGHRRLSIIDISGGQQPMSIDKNGESFNIVYNGEIYNYLDLRSQLSTRGYKFRTKSDTEVILQAYRAWGEECVNRFRGMFSFGIWNSSRNSLFLARDRLGIKPLYYCQEKGLFFFASEIKAILASKIVESTIEKKVLDSYLTLGYVPAPFTFFKGIFKLLPGQSLTIDSSGKIKDKRYWNFNNTKVSKISFLDAKKNLDQLLKKSVEMRLMSEVPLGVFLSGGLDSSAIVALMCQLTDQRIKTFSVGYEGASEANELFFAKQIAKQFQTDHHEFIMKPYDFFDSIKELVTITEEPLVEAAAIPLYQISKKAKPHATVLLSGEGSDEIFAGYSLYHKTLMINRFFPIGKLLRFVPDLCLPGDKAKKYADWLSSSVCDRFRGASGDLTARVKQSFYSQGLWEYSRKNNYLDETFSQWFRDVEGKPPLFQILYVNSKTWLPDDLLLKADKMTMATSVELRVPFLDHKIVEFAASLPSNFKLYKKEGKFILKKLMENYLPKQIIYRKKMGFTVPTRRWFAGNLLGPARDLIFSKKLLETGWFRQKYLEMMFDRHSSGKEDYSRRIFSLLVLYHWLEIYS
jgi:asparagine synthase (glutamine-hydrolysing)